MMNSKGMVTLLKSQYDKVIALLVLVFLLGSLLYLAVQIGMIRSLQAQFDREIEAMRPAHEKAAALDSARLEQAFAEIRKPFQLGAWSNAMTVPERRVACVDSRCGRPIPYEADVCPFCEAKQPKDPEERDDYDWDRDGMWDKWEKDHGLDPSEAVDGGKDADGDGFSNQEEFNAKTDPNNPEETPSIAAKLSVIDIAEDPFMLRFKSVSTLPDGSLKFQLNVRGNLKTHFVKMNEKVEGFTLVKYAPESSVEEVGGMKRTVDVSVLTLQRGDKMIPLIRNKDVQYNEYSARLEFSLDRKVYPVTIRDVLDLKGKKYEVISIDSKRGCVLIRGLQDKKVMTVEKKPGTKADTAAGRDSLPPPTKQGDSPL